MAQNFAGPLLRTAVLVAALAAGAGTVRAEDEAAPSGAEEGFSLVEEGSKLILRHILGQMKPALDDMQEGLGDAMAQLGPAMQQLSELVGDFSLYEAPVVLDNGDILIRRKEPLPPKPPEAPFGVPNADGSLDL